MGKNILPWARKAGDDQDATARGQTNEAGQRDVERKGNPAESEIKDKTRTRPSPVNFGRSTKFNVRA